MKYFVVFAVLAAVAVAAPPSQYAGNEKDAVVELFEDDNIGIGDYKTILKTSNGINIQSQGSLEKTGNQEGDVASVVRGSYSYPGPDGVVYTVNYEADQNGYRAEGAHLPK